LLSIHFLIRFHPTRLRLAKFRISERGRTHYIRGGDRGSSNVLRLIFAREFTLSSHLVNAYAAHGSLSQTGSKTTFDVTNTTSLLL